MYKIDVKSIQKISEINRLLNLLEIRGTNNISIMYGTMVLLGEVMTELQKEMNDPGIIIDNTKEKK